MRLEVRCCCQPQKLLGHVEVSEFELRCRFVRRPELMSIRDFSFNASPTDAVKMFTLPIHDFYTGAGGKTYSAIKAEGYTAEQLAKMQGFQPC